MTTLEILKAARELISAPERWTKGHFAKNGAGIATYCRSSSAVCWCASGATAWVVQDEDASSGVADDIDADVELAKTLGGSNPGDVASFNDQPTTTHAEVLALFDRTIARLEAQP